MTVQMKELDQLRLTHKWIRDMLVSAIKNKAHIACLTGNKDLAGTMVRELDEYLTHTEAVGFRDELEAEYLISLD